MFFLGKIDKMFPKSRFSKRILGHPAGSTKLDRPHCKHFRFFSCPYRCQFQKGRKGAGVKGAGVANCRIFRSAVPSVVVWSILLVSLSGVKKKLWQFMTRAPLPPAPFADSWQLDLEPLLPVTIAHPTLRQVQRTRSMGRGSTWVAKTAEALRCMPHSTRWSEPGGEILKP